MNENVKTGIFVGVAGLVVLAAVLSGPKSIDPAFYNDEGAIFFSDFTDPDQVAKLEITEFDESTASPDTFVVNFKDGRWTIPSHSDYPADAKTRMAKAAGLLIGLKKSSIRSDKAADYEALGVVNPAAADASNKGIGTLVTFRDKTGEALASLIVGKEVEGRDGMRFVRLPGKKRTYMAKIPAEVHTQFSEWIDTDLLELDAWKMSQILFDNYSVNESTGRVEMGEKILVEKKDSKWSIDSLGSDETFDEDKFKDVTSELDNLKIVGVRAKPEGIDAHLNIKKGMAGRAALESLVARGFFPGPNDKIYSNEGDLIVTTDLGVEYTLRFGEVLWGKGEALTAGAEDEGKGGEEAKKEGQKPNRFLMVSVRFNEAALDRPEKPALSEEQIADRKKAADQIRTVVAAVNAYLSAEKKLPESLADLTKGDTPHLKTLEQDPWGNDLTYRVIEGEKFEVLSLGEDKAQGGTGNGSDLSSLKLEDEEQHQKLFDEWAEFKKDVDEGTKEAEKLSQRFGPWYYVIDAASFDKLHLSRKDLVKPAKDEVGADGK